MRRVSLALAAAIALGSGLSGCSLHPFESKKERRVRLVRERLENEAAKDELASRSKDFIYKSTKMPCKLKARGANLEEAKKYAIRTEARDEPQARALAAMVEVAYKYSNRRPHVNKKSLSKQSHDSIKQGVEALHLKGNSVYNSSSIAI